MGIECESDLISRQVYGEKQPIKVVYSLTDFGKTLIPIISSLGNWGDKNEKRLRDVILKADKAPTDSITEREE